MGSRTIVTPVLIGALSVAALLVVALGLQNARLRAELEDARDRAGRPHVGLTLPTFTAATLEGDSVTVGSPDSGTSQVLFIFNTTCPACVRTLPAWEAIANELRAAGRPRTSAYGVSLDDEARTRSYVSTNGLSFPVMRFPDAKLPTLYRAVGVPLTLVVGDAGVVGYVRFGWLVDSAARDSVVAAARTSARKSRPIAESVGEAKQFILTQEE